MTVFVIGVLCGIAICAFADILSGRTR